MQPMATIYKQKKGFNFHHESQDPSNGNGI